MNLHTIETSAGPLKALNLTNARILRAEVIDGDCYRLRRLAKVFTPETMHDLGVNIGDASLLARSLWLGVQITGFDEAHELLTIAKENLPGAVLVQGQVGYGMTGHQVVSEYGYPDLLKVDIEGGEVPFFYQLHLRGMLDKFRVIVGEWHLDAAKVLLEEVLRPLFDVYFLKQSSTFFAVRYGEDPNILQTILGG